MHPRLAPALAKTLTTLALTLILPTSAAFALPSLTFETSSVSVEGATPGGEVAWLSVSRRPLQTHQRVEIYRQLATADPSGRAELVVSDPVTPKSVWAAVDLTSGEFVVAAGATGSLRERAVLSDSLVTDESGAVVALRHDRLRMEALVVRPGTETPSAWAGRVEDGGTLDEGAAYDGLVEFSPRLLPALHADQPTAQLFLPGDVVILIDPESLELSALRLGEGEAGQGGER